MLELYGAGPSRWAKPYWMLKEMGKEFKEQPVDFAKGDLKSPRIMTLNPFGKVPILKDGNTVLFESTAIMNYLGEKFPESGFVPKSGTLDRAHYDQWMSFFTTELEQPVWRVTKHTFILPEAMRDPQDVKLAKQEFEGLARILDEQVGAKKFIVGSKFTAADITLGYTLGWAQTMELVAPHKNLMRYLGELQKRPAFPGHLFRR